MLPFHKRSRQNSSIEIGTDELEEIEIPRARPPSVRPSYVMRPQLSFAHNSDDDEMTVIRMDKRPSSSPPPSSRSLQDVRIPRNPPPSFARPTYDNDEPTMLHPSSSSRPLLSMSSHRLRLHEVPPPPSSRLLDDAPRPSAAVDASASSAQRAVDLSMTSSTSGSADLSQLRRPTIGWAAGLVVAGVFAGIVGAFIARGEGLAAAASLVDPSQHVTADVAHVAAPAQVESKHAEPQAPVAIAAGVATPPPVTQAQKPAAPSCNADAVAAPVAKVESPKVVERVVERAAPPPVQHVAAPPPVVRRSEPVAQAAVAAPPPAITKPAARASARRGGDDVESASAADALAKAQLDAALSR